MKKVTVVGCGVMGSAIIRALMAKDFQVTIVDLNMEAAQPYIEKGAKYAASLDESGEEDFILLNLPTHDIAAAVIKNTSDKKLAGKILVDTTTSTPSEVKDMAAITAERNMIHLDAAIEVYPGDIGTPTGYMPEVKRHLTKQSLRWKLWEKLCIWATISSVPA